MSDGDLGTFDTRFERLTGHYRDAITSGQLKPGEQFPSARELAEKHGIGRTTAGRVHGTLISLGLIEHRPGIGTFILDPASARPVQVAAIETAAHHVIDAFDNWKTRTKPAALSDAITELRQALSHSGGGAAQSEASRRPG